MATASPWTHGSWSPPRPRRPGSSARPAYYVGRILQTVEGLVSPTVAVLGLTFKANVDDLRQSPALAITEQVAAGAPHAQILVAEPRADALPPSLARWANVRLTGCRQAVERADVVVVLVSHQEFSDLDPLLLKGRTVIDATGLWSRRSPRLAG